MTNTSKTPAATPDSSTQGVPSHLTFPVVGIGASAGGLVAVQQFLEHMPADSGMAFVIVLHLSPRHESSADKILQRSTRMPVMQVKDTTRIECDHVYVISPRLDLKMLDGTLVVAPSTRPRGALVAIDLFFRTLADAHRDRAIGIVLSGTGADGTVGIARLKEQGGVTLAQSPLDAEYDDMPKSAISSGNVDFVLAVTDMPQQLLDIWKNARSILLPNPEATEPPLRAEPDPRPAAEVALRDIIAMLAARTGHDFTHYKRATVLRRMERRLQVRMLKDLPAYRDYLRTNADETDALLADMLVSVTNFFRDRDAYEALERDVVPKIFVDRDPKEPVRVWVVGCATGEEAYSLAMLLQDEIARLASAHTYQIFATDIDERAVTFARRGVYPASIVTDVTPSRLRTYFTREDGQYKVKKALRENILFAAHNALRDPPFSRLDMVSCRNVLIYLERDIQQKLLEMFHFSLVRNGSMFLGSSESVESCSELFDPVDKRHRLFSARASTRRPNLRLPLRVTMDRGPESPRPATQAQSAAAIHQRVLELYAPPSAIVDADSNLVHMSERVGRFLQMPAGIPSHNLLALIRPEMRQELRSALFEATHARKSVEARRVRVDRDGQFYYVNMIVRPFTDGTSEHSYLLVLFEEVQATMSPDEVPELGTERHDVMLQLEAELQRVKEQLQTTIELSDTSTEELKASNEELQAINEELRSTTEELETSSEELQSVNEELITVNAELKSKVDETERVNDDLKNFIASTDIATIFVDADMRINRYTPRVELFFSILPTDVGRPLLDLTHRLDYPTLGEDIASAMGTLYAVEREVQNIEGRWFIARIRPYQTANRTITGAVITFIDITGLRIAEQRAMDDEDELRRALGQSKDFAVVVMDAEGVITDWNEGATRVFGYGADDAVGQSIDLIYVEEDVVSGRPEHERRIARATGRAEDERWHRRKGNHSVYCSGVMLPLGTDDASGYVKIVRDVTVQHQALQSGERHLAQAQARRDVAESAMALKDEFLAVMSHELKHPLNLINVNAELIARAPDLGIDRSPVASRALRTIHRAVRTQTKIIDDLLDLSRVRTGKLALERLAVDIVTLAEAATEMAAADSAASDVDLAFTASDTQILVYGDTARLNQIIWNLLSNAVKFTPAGGEVRVAIATDRSFCRVEVSDSGIGIEPAFLPKVFDMFGQARVRAASAQGGLGIGLALVRQLVELHDGRIEASSDGPGKGARFCVWIPLYQQALGPPRLPHRDEPSGSVCAGLRLLVVDDDAFTVDAFRTLLELEGAQVTTAVSAAQALDLLNAQPFDIVFTDLGMPERDGYALLKDIQSQPQLDNLSVVALSGFARESDLRRTAEAGFAAHLGKPVDMSQLFRIVAQLREPDPAM